MLMFCNTLILRNIYKFCNIRKFKRLTEFIKVFSILGWWKIVKVLRGELFGRDIIQLKSTEREVKNCVKTV